MISCSFRFIRLLLPATTAIETESWICARISATTRLARCVSRFGCYKADEWLLGGKGWDMCHTASVSGVTHFSIQKWCVSSIVPPPPTLEYSWLILNEALKFQKWYSGQPYFVVMDYSSKVLSLQAYLS